jgi:4-carboxymuconolactone decarboxylase
VPPPQPTDDNIIEWLMGDETSKTRMQEASDGPGGATRREVFGSMAGVIWSRRVLPVRTAALMNLAILASINRPHELYTRVLGLLRGGVSVEEIQEVFLQINFYVGNPAGMEATVMLHEAMRSLEDRGIEFNMRKVES